MAKEKNFWGEVMQISKSRKELFEEEAQNILLEALRLFCFSKAPDLVRWVRIGMRNGGFLKCDVSFSPNGEYISFDNPKFPYIPELKSAITKIEKRRIFNTIDALQHYIKSIERKLNNQGVFVVIKGDIIAITLQEV